VAAAELLDLLAELWVEDHTLEDGDDAVEVDVGGGSLQGESGGVVNEAKAQRRGR
jgi:hypothetical protein